MKYVGVWIGLLMTATNLVLYVLLRSWISLVGGAFCLGCALVSLMVARNTRILK